MMKRYIAHITLVVNDYDEAIRFYCDKLGFVVTEDTYIDKDKRWVVISPEGTGSCSLLLAKATTEEQRSRIGDQTGGRVAFFLYTDDFWRDYKKLLGSDVKFIRAPKKEQYGIVAVFEDLYGNLWGLIEPPIGPANT